jgi:hypothetical protein
MHLSVMKQVIYWLISFHDMTSEIHNTRGDNLAIILRKWLYISACVTYFTISDRLLCKIKKEKINMVLTSL